MHEHHNPRDDVSRGKSSGERAFEGLVAIKAKLETTYDIIKNINQNIHDAQVIFGNCSGLHLTKDYDLHKNGKKRLKCTIQVVISRMNIWSKSKKE